MSREKPILSGKRAFVAAAREAFEVAEPARGELLPPECDSLAAGVHEDDPWLPHERDCASRALAHYRAGAASFVRCGDELRRAKDSMRHGRFQRWIAEQLPMSGRTASQLMQIARDENIRRYVDQNGINDSVLLPPDKAVLAELCGMPAAEFDDLIGGGVIHVEMRRGDLRRHRVQVEHSAPDRQPPPLPRDGKYGVVYADPPWPFQVFGGANDRSAENHYPTMPLSEIELLPVRGLLADDCALFLWCPAHLLMHAPHIMTRWGFEMRSTGFIWVKEGGAGMGYWTRKGAELCLLGTRGSPKRLSASVQEVVYAPRGGHSEKPAEVRARIERLVAGPYIELFAREVADGWDAWGHLEGGG